MQSYSTRQRKVLLAYLSQHPDELLSARQIADALADKKISLSAVYRNLAQLETEEKVRRSSKSGTREVYYQYLDAESCKGALHMSCIKCGKTFHMADGNAALLAKHLAQSEQFILLTRSSMELVRTARENNDWKGGQTMTKKFRFMTGLLAVVLAFVMLSSVAYIAAESDHECTGVDCAICHQINVCENLLKSIGLAGSAAATVAAILYILCRIIPSCIEVARTFTLVSLKVKLSD